LFDNDGFFFLSKHTLTLITLFAESPTHWGCEHGTSHCVRRGECYNAKGAGLR